jgi:ADP-heptose:LPS heptosyltransferase
MTAPTRLADAREVAVLRALPGLGDMLCAIPALRALRRGLPGARIRLIGLPAVRGLMARFPAYADELVAFPGFPGVKEVPLDPPRTAAFLARAVRQPPDVAIQLHGSGQTTNAFVALLGAGRTAGFFLPGLLAPDPEWFMPYPAGEPEPLRHLALMRFLGLPVDDGQLEFPLTEEDLAEAGRLVRRHGLGGPYACVNPGASEARRRWPAERFAAVADGLAVRGLRPVLVGGPADAPLASAVAERMAAAPVDLSGQTSLGAVGAIVSGAAVTVTNDTGTSHLAAALRAPSVVIFTGSDPRRWAPVDAVRHRVLGTIMAPALDEPRRRCLRDGCRLEGDLRVTEVAPRDVLEATDDVLGASSPLP